MKRGYQVDGVNVNAQRAVTQAEVRQAMTSSQAPSWARMPTNRALYEHFEAGALLEWRTLPLWKEARRAAVHYFTDCVDCKAQYVTVCMRSDGRVQLWTFGPNGGMRSLWCFGTPRGAA